MVIEKENIIIIGTGAQAKYIVDTLSFSNNQKISALVKTGRDIDEKFNGDLGGIKIIENLEDFKKYIFNKENVKAIVGVADNQKKEFFINELEKLNIELINVIHPRATVSKTVKLGKNVLINAGTVIQPYVSIGDGVMIHANVIVDHNSIIEDYVNLGPGAKLAGWVKVGKGAYIYTGSSVIPNINIGARSVVGAGSVVIKNVPAGATVVGNPAKVIKVK